MDTPQKLLDGTATIVVKIGSSILIDESGAPRLTWMKQLAARLARRGGPVVLVSSGAIALGRLALGISGRPAKLAEAQAAAAVGQIRLAQLWSEVWTANDRITAQVLLTLGDLEVRGRYLNARNTLETLLERGVIPVVNENDTVATGEIRFGDNDRLAARVAQLVGARLLVLLSDIDGLYDADPRLVESARLIADVDSIDADIEALAGPAQATGFGTGGMASKLAAADIATTAGCPVLLTSGHGDQDPIERYLQSARGTLFHAAEKPPMRRKQWLRSLQQHEGTLELDAGAVAALRQGASLLAAGVTGVRGQFQRGALVALQAPDGICGQGLCGYDAE
ncbi:MAG: glutamate 5-kinase, partial [Wenzhouxiangellaceae bacterium]|nr:glutamate 5-kinase [Wenzhouxiangellaceae bacterium]